jgi:hypothetical protein
MKTAKMALILITAIPVFAQAGQVDEEVSRIFDRSQRQLASPPKSLRSKSRVKDDSRFQEGLNRVQRRMSATAEDLSNEPAGEGPQSGSEPIESKVDAPLVPSAASPSETRRGKIVIIRESRKEKRQGLLENYSFDGNRAVGLGLVGGGAYGIFGAELDLGFGSKWSGGFGLGTGMAYSTWGLYARKYFLEGPISTFIQLGYAHWNIPNVPYREKTIYPGYLSRLFFGDSTDNLQSKKRVHLIYPSTGILYQTKSGLAYSAAIQYFINAANFTGALYASLGMHFYF